MVRCLLQVLTRQEVGGAESLLQRAPHSPGEGAQPTQDGALRNHALGPATEALIDKILLIPALGEQPGLRAALCAECVLYYGMAANVHEDIPLLPWWHAVRNSLPTFYNHVLPQAVLLQPTSASAERVFAMMDWMFSEQQQAALEDYKETALMLRYNELQRVRTTPANMVMLI